MRVVVAGGAGFIGASLCRRLLAGGHRVVCVDNLVTGARANVEELEGSAFTLVEADVCRSLQVAGPIDAVINLASPASPADFEPLALEILDVGSRGTGALLDLAADRGARFLQASTSEVYGDPQVHPQPETYFGHVNPVGPRSMYDEAKRFGEALVTAHHRRRGTDVRMVRIFNTYGPRMRADDGRLVSNFVTQALAGEPLTVHGDGHQTRSLCYVEDLVTGLLAVLESDYRGPVNLGSEDERTVLEVAQLVVAIAASPSPITFVPAAAGDPSRRRPDTTLVRRLTGWRPSTSLEEGLERTVEWFAGAGATRR
ncbi:MAG TPA: NAD-dependent epimerase/dehydratase family protein [Acidimicrobiales bacterium]|nr:NAD-dependent epimerase/dehydratase family protein [Acidimicrobiales bacterium]